MESALSTPSAFGWAAARSLSAMLLLGLAGVAWSQRRSLGALPGSVFFQRWLCWLGITLLLGAATVLGPAALALLLAAVAWQAAREFTRLRPELGKPSWLGGTVAVASASAPLLVVAGVQAEALAPAGAAALGLLYLVRQSRRPRPTRPAARRLVGLLHLVRRSRRPGAAGPPIQASHFERGWQAHDNTALRSCPSERGAATHEGPTRLRWGIVRRSAPRNAREGVRENDGRRHGAVFGVVWIGIGLAHLAALRTQVGPELVVLVCAMVALGDVGAFLVGRALGGPRLAPKISPNKTWAGVTGNVIGSAAALAVLPFAVPASWSLERAGALAALVAIGSVAGDLLESLQKRRAGVKDAGSILPGFGGVLDRIDSLLVAAPLAYWFVVIS